MSLPRVLIIDDHQVVADGLVRLLDGRFDVLGTVSDSRLAVATIATLRPHAVLLDLSMPNVSGFDVIRGVIDRRIETRIIVLTMHAEPQLAVEALTAGASGFMLKESSGDELVAALEVVLGGGTYLTSAITRDAVTLMMESGTRPRIELTAEQRSVLRLIVQGQRAKEIASSLDISTRRVEATKYKLMRLLQVPTTAQLIKRAVEHRLVHW
jgi:DNA-binding NarL/FixJ family response regulator